MSAAVSAPFAPPYARESAGPWRLRADDGRSFPLNVDRWYRDASPEEAPILERALDATLDIGCGPGRHVVALAERGVRALGVDVAPAAVAVARARGARAVSRSIFSRLPGTGRWGSALLLDGNIGIGGDPPALLARARSLLRSGGNVLVEVEPPGMGIETLRVRVERDGAEAGAWFSWAIVAADEVARLGGEVGLGAVDVLVSGGRWFASLEVP